MIPPYIDPAESPPGEVMLFDLLRDEPGTDDWTVLHSLDLPRHVRQVSGELDFLVLIPGGAVLCLEVKSHQQVSRLEDGLWKLGGDPPTLRSPFKQASDAMHTVRTELKSDQRLSSVPFVSAVVFPRCDFSAPSVEWDPWQVVDERVLRNVGVVNALRRVALSARQKLSATPTASWFSDGARLPTADQCDLIVNRLRPRFEQHRTAKARRAERVEELQKYTNEQFGALDALDLNQRLLFTGAAGTGKTFVALEAARRSALAGKRVLLCCYNNLLGQWLSSEAAPQGAVTAGTAHSLMVHESGVAVPQNPSPQWWSALPGVAAEAVLETGPSGGAYDVLIVDEAQDLCGPDVLDFLDLMVVGGLRDGSFRMFGDFEGQSIYSGTDGRDELGRRCSWAAYAFTQNCRNRPSIGRLAAVASQLGSPYAAFRRADDGLTPSFRLYADDDAQVGVLCAAIDSMRAEGYQLGDIVILSVKADGAAARLPAPYNGQTCTAAPSPGNKMRSGTVQAFKGLDSSAVIVTDIDSVVDLYSQQVLYVACSRATDRLTLLVQESAAPDLLDFLAKGEALHG